MGTKVFVGNLPAGTTAEEVREEWAKGGAPILGVEPVEGGNPDKLAFEVELDIDAQTAKLMADRRRDHFFKGRRINVFVATPRG
jgi:hypothetical protein